MRMRKSRKGLIFSGKRRLHSVFLTSSLHAYVQDTLGCAGVFLQDGCLRYQVRGAVGNARWVIHA